MKFYSYFDGNTVFTNISGCIFFLFFFLGGGAGEGADKSLSFTCGVPAVMHPLHEAKSNYRNVKNLTLNN